MAASSVTVRITLAPAAVQAMRVWIRMCAIAAPMLGPRRALRLAERGGRWLVLRGIRMATEVEPG